MKHIVNKKIEISLSRLFVLFLFIVLAGQISVFAQDVDLISQRPPGEGPTKIEISFFMIDLMKVDNVNETFSADIYFIAKWHDSRLKGEMERVLKTSEVWMPNVLVFNKRNVTSDLREVVTVRPDGTVVYRQRLMGSFASSLNLHRFPMDSQTLAIELVSHGTKSDEVLLVGSPKFSLGHNPEYSIRDWEIGDMQLVADEYQPIPGAKPLSRLTISVDIVRYWKYYFIQMLVPLILIVAMSWMPFWINPEIIATRIGTSVTTVLTLIAYRFMFGSQVPKLPYLTMLDILLFGITMLVAVTLATLAIQSILLKNHSKIVEKIDNVARIAHPVVFILLMLTIYFSYS